MEGSPDSICLAPSVAADTCEDSRLPGLNLFGSPPNKPSTMPPNRADSGEKDYTVVVSGDDFEFVCQKNVLMDGSKMFKGMLESGSR